MTEERDILKKAAKYFANTPEESTFSSETIVMNFPFEPCVVFLKSTPVDLHASEFPVGKVVSTVFAKSGAMICRVAEGRFALVVRRSFADEIWLWIQDASREYGLVVHH